MPAGQPADPPPQRLPPPPQDVAIALIEAGGRLLVGRRPRHKPLGGLWEFPGGKIRPGESPRQALVREVHEELGIGIEITAPLPPLLHLDPLLPLRLHPFTCRLLPSATVGGGPPEVTSQAHEELRWAFPGELARLEFPPANAPLLTALQR